MLNETDYLVVGSGLAGLTYALRAARHGTVGLLTKKTRADANSSWAQGGIAGAMADDDSFELHKRDTLVAGAGLCHEEAVEVLVREGPERIRDLIALGARFNMETGGDGQEVLELGREGGHSRNRIVHTADYTGWECERTLLEAVRKESAISVHEHLFVTNLAMADTAEGPACAGADAIDVRAGRRVSFRAHATLLATGGSGHVYRHTTNPLVATGDGVAMAWRAGAAVANMEFVQFHPTTLFHPAARAFLITEALRGEGGILRHADGETFIERYHPLGALAPRDIVARAIVSELRRRNVECVYLDVTHLPADRLKSHFPTVYERCLSVGLDITREPIPIVPAQHYQCGGVLTDLYGATTIPRLFAAGEAACTGVHGANRLASNSLLEALVFGWRAANRALDLPPLPRTAVCSSMDRAPANLAAEPLDETARLRSRAQDAMQSLVGILRTTSGLAEARRELNAVAEAQRARPDDSVDGLEAANIVQTGLVIVESALRRHESRGLHFVEDFPAPLESERHDTVLQP